jgi:hypothetical protein
VAGAININFGIAGKEDVLRAMRGISQTAAKLGREGVRAAANEQKKAEKEVADAAKRSAKEVADAQKKASRDAANEKKKADRDAAREKRKLDKEAADFQRELDKVGARNFRERVKEQIKVERDAARERAKIARDAERQAEKASNTRRRVAGDYAGGAAGGFKTGVRTIAAVGAMATGGLGAATVVDAARAQLSLDERAAALKNSSDMKGFTFKNADGSERKVGFVEQAKKISGALGVDAGEVMGGFEKIAAKAGKAGLQEATSQLESLAKVARGAGINMTDLGDVVATLTNRGVKAEDLVSTVEALVKQGQDGAVEFKDLATMLDASSGALGRFEMGEKDRIMSAGGLSQMARTYGKSSAAEATNAVVDLARDLGGKADIVQQLTGGKATTVTTKGKKTVKMVNGQMVTTTEGASTRSTYAGGVEVGTDDSRAKLRNMNDLLPEMIDAAIKHGTVGKLTGEGGVFTGNSVSIVAPLIEAATKGIVKDGDKYRLAGAGEQAQMTGQEAARALLDQFNAATLEAGKSEAMLAEVLKTDAGKISVATNKLKNDLGDKLAPVISKLAPDILSLGESFGKAVVWIAENPKKAAAGFVALSTAMSVAEVGLGKLGTFVLDKLFSKTTPMMNVTAGVVNVGGAPGVGGAGGSGLKTLATGAGVGLGGAAAIAAAAVLGAADSTYAGMDTGAKRADKNRSLAVEAENEAVRLRHGGGDRAKAQGLLNDLENSQGVRGALGRFWEGATEGGRNLMNGKNLGFNTETAENALRLAPTMAFASGVGAMVNGGNASPETSAAIETLKNALNGTLKVDPGFTAADIAGAVNNNTQSPKAAPP